MKKSQKLNRIIKDRLIDSLFNHIMSDAILSVKYTYNYKTRKYNIKQLLGIIIDVLRLGICWRNTNKLKITGNIHWNTVYKTYIKLLSDNIIEKCYTKTLNIYLQKKPATKLNIRMTDTSVIFNKLGEENIARNKYHKNKKTTKISLITDKNGIPLNVKTYSGNKHDSSIFLEQIDLENKYDPIKDQKFRKFMLADKGYDSSKIRNKLRENKFIPLIAYNKRNTKNKKKLMKLTEAENKIYKNRIVIEQTFMKIKRNRRIDIRYDRKIKTYEGFVLMGILDLILKAI